MRMEELTERHAREICDWKYDGEYAIYNYLPWSRACDEQWGITVAAKREKEFFAVMDDTDCFCGYIRMLENDGYTWIGVGLKPSLCGQGLGSTLMEIVKQQCAKLYPGQIIALEVRSFNKRAIKCYHKAGFRITEVYQKETPLGQGEFIRMEYR